MSVGRPILASDTSLFGELQEQVGVDWVRLINGELDADILLNAMEHASKLKESKVKPDLSLLEWETIAEQTASFYYQVLFARSRHKN